MRLLCLGDVAISSNENKIPNLTIPTEINVDHETRILFNWEVPIGNQINPIPRTSGGIRLVAPPNSVKSIANWAPGFAALATNHMMDAGENGLHETMHILQKNGFKTFGAGFDHDEISKPMIWETNEGKLAIVNWVFPETDPDWNRIPGSNCWPGKEQAKKIIEDLKNESDWILAYLHWSNELFPYPSEDDRQVAESLVFAGVDIVIGHHPHVVRGMEEIECAKIFYSLGNFYFSDFSNGTNERNSVWAPKNKESIGVLIEFVTGNPPSVQVHSFRQTKNKVIIDPKQSAIKDNIRLSKPFLQIQSQGYKKWYERQFKLFSKYYIWWNFGIRKLGLRGLFNYTINKLRNLN